MYGYEEAVVQPGTAETRKWTKHDMALMTQYEQSTLLRNGYIIRKTVSITNEICCVRANETSSKKNCIGHPVQCIRPMQLLHRAFRHERNKILQW